jgi:hypothetical protein
MTIQEFARIYAALQRSALSGPVFNTCVNVIIQEVTREETLPLEKARDDRYQKLLETNRRLVRDNEDLKMVIQSMEGV